jgi:NAD+ kinase
MDKPKTLIIGSARKPKVEKVITEILPKLRKKLDVIAVKFEENADYSKMDIGLVVVFGGDGTMLSAARMLGGNKAPAIGVNMGWRGFLTQSNVKTLLEDLDDYLNAKVAVCERTMLSVRVFRDNKLEAQFLALNDAVVSALRFARMVRLKLSISGQFVHEYPCDGVIISTPTGSTAHSLSAGGPIVLPHSNLFVVSPIATHSFVDRSLVVPSDEYITITHGKNIPESCLTIDGQVEFSLKRHDELEINEAVEKFYLVEFAKKSFYETVRRKIR